MELLIHSGGVAQWRGLELRCALGRSGVTANKTEGDGTTPIGAFKIRKILFRADRTAPPDTALPVTTIGPNDGWCDAPDNADYNRQVILPHQARCESLWRDDHVYDLIAVTTYNEAPVISANGSAIFMHIARDSYAGTAGCVAFSEPGLRLILAEWRIADVLRIFET